MNMYFPSRCGQFSNAIPKSIDVFANIYFFGLLRQFFTYYLFPYFALAQQTITAKIHRRIGLFFSVVVLYWSNSKTAYR